MRCRKASSRWSARSTWRSTTRSVRSCSPNRSTCRRCSAPRAGAGMSGAPRHRWCLAPRARRDEGDYLNCPMTKAEYDAFYAALVAAESATVHDFDNTKFFEGCLPIEVMAHRGEGTLRFGPMKPVGLKDPRTGQLPYAVVQLRQDTLAGDHYSLVGFQTQIKWGDQARVLKMIPGLENAEFVRYGMVHRNTYICGPKVLLPTWQTRHRADLLFAGQVSGVEGYVESAASGLIAGRNAAAHRQGRGAAGAAAHHGDRLAGLLRVARRPEDVSADQHHARHHAAARSTAARQDEEEADDCRTRAGRSGRVAWRQPQVRRHASRQNLWRRTFRSVDISCATISNLSSPISNSIATCRRTRCAPMRATSRSIWRGWRAKPARRCRQLAAADLDMTSARSHLAELNKAGKARSSVARKLSALKTFVRYLRREDLIEHDPTAMAVAPKRDQTIPTPLSRTGDHQADRNAQHRRSAGPARSRHSRAVLRLRAAVERAGGRRPGRPQPERAHGAGHGQGRQGTPAAVQSKCRRRRSGVDEGSGRDPGAKSPAEARSRAEEAGRQREDRRRNARSLVHQLPRDPPDRPQRRSPAEEIRRAVQHAHGHQPARVAPLVRHAPAAARRRPPRHPGAAGPRAR